MRAPWMGNFATSMCLLCGDEFGIFNRRHHCRQCGGLFCDRCSKKRAKGITGYETEVQPVRVCDICYYQDLAYLIVYNLRFSGFHSKIFADRAEAEKAFDEIPLYASRVLLKMGTGEIIKSYYCREAWQRKITAHVEVQLRKHLKQRIPITWGNTGSSVRATPVAFSPAPTVQQRQAAPAGPQSAKTAAGDIIHGVIVVFRQEKGDATDHLWIFNPEGSVEESIAEGSRLLDRIPGLLFGAILQTNGTVHCFKKTPSMAGSQQAFEVSLRQYVSQLGVMMASHEHGEYQTAYFPNLAAGIAAAESKESAILLDNNGALIVAKNCTRSWREGLARCAGNALLVNQQLAALIVCIQPNSTHLFDNMFLARKKLEAEKHSAMFAVAAGSNGSPALFQRNFNITKDVALAMSQLASSVVEHARSETPRLEGSENAPSPTAPAASTSSTPECQICFTGFNVGPNKPCLCPACGNSLCYACIRSVSQCPFCRKDFNPANPVITNIQLLQIISGVTD